MAYQMTKEEYKVIREMLDRMAKQNESEATTQDNLGWWAAALAIDALYLPDDPSMIAPTFAVFIRHAINYFEENK